MALFPLPTLAAILFSQSSKTHKIQERKMFTFFHCYFDYLIFKKKEYCNDFDRKIAWSCDCLLISFAHSRCHNDDDGYFVFFFFLSLSVPLCRVFCILLTRLRWSFRLPMNLHQPLRAFFKANIDLTAFISRHLFHPITRFNFSDAAFFPIPKRFVSFHSDYIANIFAKKFCIWKFLMKL